MVTSQGDLHIRAARPEDGRATYSCLTFHALTGERRRSEPATLTVAGMLFVFLHKPYFSLIAGHFSALAFYPHITKILLLENKFRYNVTITKILFNFYIAIKLICYYPSCIISFIIIAMLQFNLYFHIQSTFHTTNYRNLNLNEILIEVLNNNIDCNIV